MAVSPNGNAVFVTGDVDSATESADYLTAAFDAATGSVLWSSQFNGSVNGFDDAYAVAVSPDGTTVFVTGQSYSQTGNDYMTLAYDAATGHQSWMAAYNGNGNDYAYSVAVSPDGTRVFVTGESVGPSGSTDYATVAYASASGQQLWVARYNDRGNGSDMGISVAVTPDGTRVLVTGMAYISSKNKGYVTMAYSASTGRRLWLSRYAFTGNGTNLPHSLAVSPDGATAFVTGQSHGPTSVSDYATVAYDVVSGHQLWVARYNGPGNGADVAFSVRVSPDGSRVFVTGEAVGTTLFNDYGTVAYDSATGQQLWVASYEGTGGVDDDSYSLAVSADGLEVLVTGDSTGNGTNHDYATLAYDAQTGQQLWLARYDGSPYGDDAACCLAVGPDLSKVFVTGHSTGSSGAYDMTTVAYQA